jgi:hypothetical protein
MGRYEFLNESIVLDSITDLTNEEKLALIFLHNKFKNVKYDFELNINKLIDLVEDDLGLSFTTSLKVAKLYKTKRDFLFQELVKDKENNTEIIYEFLKKYRLN